MAEKHYGKPADGEVLGHVIAALPRYDRIGFVRERCFAEVSERASKKGEPSAYLGSRPPYACRCSELPVCEPSHFFERRLFDLEDRAEAGGLRVVRVFERAYRRRSEKLCGHATRGQGAIEVRVKRDDRHAELSCRV